MGGHDDHIVPHGFPGASEEVPQNPEGMEEVIGDVDEVSEVRSRVRSLLRVADQRTQGLASDVDSDSDSSVDSISSAATTVSDINCHSSSDWD